MGYLAGIVAGLTAASVTGLVGATHVVGLAFIASLGLVAVTLRIQRNYAAELMAEAPTEEDESEATSDRASLRELFKHPLALLIFVMVGITIVEYYIFDNVFYDFAEKRYPGEAAFAAFYGTFSAGVNLASLIMLGGFSVTKTLWF